MKKISLLPLTLVGVLLSASSSMAADVDNELLTVIKPNSSGVNKFTQVSSVNYSSSAFGGTNSSTYASSGISNSSSYDSMIRASAERHGVDPALVKAIIHTESSFNPYARSPAGAQGLMQLMPGTARDMGVMNVWDPAQNIEGGVKYIAWLSQRFSNRDHIIAAYNAGHANVRRYGGTPPFKETRNYVRKVNSRYQTLYVNDTNLMRGSSYQLAMNTAPQTNTSPTPAAIHADSDSTPQTPTLSQVAGRVYVNKTYTTVNSN